MRPYWLAVVGLLLVFAGPAPALIMVGRGNDPVTDAGWPAGSLPLANLKTRVGWSEGPPFGGGEWAFLYRGDTAALGEAVKLLGEIRAPAVQLVLHDGGPRETPFLREDKDRKSDATFDWSFTVWVPANWHRLYNDPRSTFMADSPNFRKPVDAPRLDVFLSAKLDWSKIAVPQNVTVIDRRGAGENKTGARAARLPGDVFDMATGKPVGGAAISVMANTADGNAAGANAIVAVAKATADADGRFELDGLPDLSNQYARVTIEAKGYATRTVGLAELVGPTAGPRANVQLSPAADLTGIAIDTDGKPVAGLRVTVMNSMGLDGRGYTRAQASEATTDAAGHFKLADLPTGYAQVHATAAGWYPLDSLKVHAVGGARQVGTGSLTIRVVATGTVRGKVLDARGNPARDGTISVNPPGDPVGKWGGSMNLKPDGSFEFTDVPPGPYTVSRGGYAEQQITVAAGKVTEVTLKP
jgi:hypothetical protein